MVEVEVEVEVEIEIRQDDGRRPRPLLGPKLWQPGEGRRVEERRIGRLEGQSSWKGEVRIDLFFLGRQSVSI